jgi:hypothetical protein
MGCSDLGMGQGVGKSGQGLDRLITTLSGTILLAATLQLVCCVQVIALIFRDMFVCGSERPEHNRTLT